MVYGPTRSWPCNCTVKWKLIDSFSDCPCLFYIDKYLEMKQKEYHDNSKNTSSGTCLIDHSCV